VPGPPDVVILSSIDWGSLWQGPQEIAVRLGRAGRKVLYVENTGVRTPRLSDARRVAARLARWGRTVGTGQPEIAPNVWLCSPLMLPPFGPAWQRALNRRVFVPRVVQTARALGIGRVQIWTFLPTDTALDVIDGFGAACESLVYNCGADFTQLTPDHGKLQAIEREVVQRSTAVFTNCELLARRFSPIHPRVRALPGGVSLEAFPLDPPGDPPQELRALPRPIIGYVGGLHRHLAMDLLVAMARARPHWSWVYVGPHQTDVGPLAALSNVHRPRPRPHHDLARYIHQFDACTIPYARSVYTDTVVPMKLNEYLAMGKAVVSTDLPALADAPEVMEAIWTSPPAELRFLAAIEAALLAGQADGARTRRRALAEAASWEVRLGQMLSEARMAE
jgi:glycosyltransferase involved in cell wall biosynthesis